MTAVSTTEFRKICRAGICDRCGAWGTVIMVHVDIRNQLIQAVDTAFAGKPLGTVKIQSWVELCDWCQLAWSWGLRELR